MICRKCRHLNPPGRLVCQRCKSLVTTVRLKVITGNSESFLSLPLRDFTLGRSSDNDLIIPDDGVSRHHARLRFIDGNCEVEDLHSKNGLFLNGVRTRQQRLRHRDCLQIGETRIFLLCDAITEEATSDEEISGGSAESDLGKSSPAAQSVARMRFAWQRLLLQCAIKVAHAQEAVLVRRTSTGKWQIVAHWDATSNERLFLSPTGNAAPTTKRQGASALSHQDHHQLPIVLSSDEQELARECLESDQICSIRAGRHQPIQTVGSPAPAVLRCSTLALPLQRRGSTDTSNAARIETAPHLILLRWPRREQPLSSTRLASLQQFGSVAATCVSNAENGLAQGHEGTPTKERHATGKTSTSTFVNPQTACAQSHGSNESSPLPFYDLAWWSNPAGPVSGDYFEAIPLNDNEVMIVQADISGKSELMTMLLCLLQVGIHLLIPVVRSPLKITEALNRLLLTAMPDSIFVTLFMAVLDRRHQVLRYVNAGHPPALVVTLTSGQPALQLLRNSGPALGVIDSPDLREEAMPWSAGATLLIYTDGIIEARRGNEPQFSLDGLTQTVLEHFRSQPNSPPNNLLEVICTALPSPSANHHSVDFHRDDQTLLALRVQ